MWNSLISMQDISFIMHNGFNLVQCDEALKEWKRSEWIIQQWCRETCLRLHDIYFMMLPEHIYKWKMDGRSTYDVAQKKTLFSHQNVFQACKSKDTSFKHMPNSDNTQQTSSLLSPRLQLILFNQVFHQLLVHPGYRHICSRLNDLTQL